MMWFISKLRSALMLLIIERAMECCTVGGVNVIETNKRRIGRTHHEWEDLSNPGREVDCFMHVRAGRAWDAHVMKGKIESAQALANCTPNA